MAKWTFASGTFKSRTFGSRTWAGPQTVVTPLTLVWSDRVWEGANAPGTGNVTPTGALVGRRTFGSVLHTGDVCYGCIQDQNAGGPNWEVTQLTMNSDGTLTRGVYTFAPDGTPTNTGLPLDSSAGGAVVNFASGVQDVFLHVPAAVLPASLVTPNFAPVVR